MGEIFERTRPKTPFAWTGERLTSEVTGQVEIEHLHRYFLARELCRGLSVLDIACGEGYGAAILAQVASSVIGVDISGEVIAHAASAYARPNLHFLKGDARSIPLEDSSVDAVVSFETLEHFSEHGVFIAEVKRVLRPQGRLLLSTPERSVYSQPGRQPNPFHVRELTLVEFSSLLQKEFKHVSIYLQRPIIGSALMAESTVTASDPILTFEKHDSTHYEASVGLGRATYLIAAASDVPTATRIGSLFIESGSLDALFAAGARGQEHAELPKENAAAPGAGVTAAATAQIKRLQSELDDIYRSRSWKIASSLRVMGRTVAPKGTLRAQIARAVWHGLRDVGSGLRLPVRVPLGAGAQTFQRRILVMDSVVPSEEISAGDRATVGILRDLCKVGYEVFFFPANLTNVVEREKYLAKLGVKVVAAARRYGSPAQFIRENGHRFSVFYLFRFEVAEAVLGTIREVATQSVSILHTVDVCFLREGREAELKNDPLLFSKSQATKERELAAMRQSDRTVVVSPVEAQICQELLPDVPISVFPALYAPIVEEVRGFDGRKGICFLGNFAHPPNADAVRWFAAEIWPLVHEQLPGVLFHIVGREADKAVPDLASQPGIAVDGFIEDLEPVLGAMRVGVAPLRFGAGIKGKVAMMMGAGLPCVCTSVASEGMAIDSQRHAPIADSPREFAEAVVRLYSDREQWLRYADAGRVLVRGQFSPEGNRASLLNVLRDAGALSIPLWIDYCRALPARSVPCPPKDESVDVSVVIPAYNQWKLTRTCINSIIESCAGGDIRYEVILADDNSTDETTRAAEFFPGLCVARTQRNLGFLRNCNEAAKSARGRYLLLLNNDTIVLPGWLSSLYRLIEQDETVAITGSKLVYPDETIQEAGGVIWSDASAINFGRGRARNAVGCNYVREVDYISGASILIRRSFWERMGGFDERYEEGYCEDSDLAMAARACGMRVVYQPSSEVVHLEYQSHGATASLLMKVNVPRLQEKWRTTLSTNHVEPSSPFHVGVSNAQRSTSSSALRRRRDGFLNFLWCSPFPSHPGTDGNRLSVRNFGSLLKSMGHKAYFVMTQDGPATRAAADEMRAFWDAVHIIPDDSFEDGMGERVADLCSRHDIDVVLCSWIFQSKILEFVPKRILKIIDTSATYDSDPSSEHTFYRPEEMRDNIQGADVIITEREGEARYFDELAGRRLAIVVPHLQKPQFLNKSFLRLRELGMVLDKNPRNFEILRDCVAAIDSSLRGDDCPFTFHVAGELKGTVDELPYDERKAIERPWLKIHGFVKDIESFYAYMDLVISPSGDSGRMSVWTLEAMAYGIPVLATKAGSEGIETSDEMHSHPDLASLAGSLFALTRDRPDELDRLAGLSRSAYLRLHELAKNGVRRMLAHPKLG